MRYFTQNINKEMYTHGQIANLNAPNAQRLKTLPTAGKYRQRPDTIAASFVLSALQAKGAKYFPLYKSFKAARGAVLAVPALEPRAPQRSTWKKHQESRVFQALIQLRLASSTRSLRR